MPPSAPSRPEALATDVRAGSRRALAKAITLVESTRADHQRAAQRLLELLLPDTGRAARVGVSGVPGVGKSTFIEAFGLHLIGLGKKVAVLADALAINKADGENVRPAEQAAAQYRSALRLFRHASAGWDPPVVTVSALEGRGMDKVWSIIEDHRGKLGPSGALERRRREQQRAWFWTMIDDGLKGHFLARDDVQRLLPEMETAVASARLTPTEAARRLLALLDEGGAHGGRTAVRSRRARSA